VKLVHLVGFITKKFVTMHGNTNVKFLTLEYGTDRLSRNVGKLLPINAV